MMLKFESIEEINVIGTSWGLKHHVNILDFVSIWGYCESVSTIIDIRTSFKTPCCKIT